MAEKLQKFQSDVFSQHPELREKRKVDNIDFVSEDIDHLKKKASSKWDEEFLKKHLKLFLYLTFDLEFDKATNALSRIALLRKHIYELKVIVPEIE